jgi:hypothetical protein
VSPPMRTTCWVTDRLLAKARCSALGPYWSSVPCIMCIWLQAPISGASVNT